MILERTSVRAHEHTHIHARARVYVYKFIIEEFNISKSLQKSI